MMKENIHKVYEKEGIGGKEHIPLTKEEYEKYRSIFEVHMTDRTNEELRSDFLKYDEIELHYHERTFMFLKTYSENGVTYSVSDGDKNEEIFAETTGDKKRTQESIVDEMMKKQLVDDGKAINDCIKEIIYYIYG